MLNLWQKNNVFGPDVIQPLMDMADPNHPLHQEIQQQQNANGEYLFHKLITTKTKIMMKCYWDRSVTRQTG